MHIPAEAAIHLIHAVPFGALATHSTELAGFPFATALPFVPDAGHRPMFLVSWLAEHTKNLLADPRASLLLVRAEEGDVLAGARLTLLGEVIRFEPSDGLVARYLSYQPEAARYLALGDFSFFRLEPRRLRMIAGFGQMGWVEGAALAESQILSEADEARLLPAVADAMPDGTRLLGVDRYGADLDRAGRRERLPFSGAPVAVERLAEALREGLGV
jgi:putative heme iron utilization protein